MNFLSEYKQRKASPPAPSQEDHVKPLSSPWLVYFPCAESICLVIACLALSECGAGTTSRFAEQHFFKLLELPEGEYEESELEKRLLKAPSQISVVSPFSLQPGSSGQPPGKHSLLLAGVPKWLFQEDGDWS